MLYVFLVDTGSMLTLDMNLAMGSVAALKESIYDKTGIPEDKQVLLINGGEGLNVKSRVCDYCAGTDTSPIFLFSKTAIELSTPPTPSIDHHGSTSSLTSSADVDLKDRIDSCLNMEPSYQTVIARTELAKQICDISNQIVRDCEKLIHDQHLQHQGWQAVVANLEDVVSIFKGSWHALEGQISQFFQQKSQNESFLESFHDDLSMLTKIPMIKELSGSSNGNNDEQTTLFDWINSKDHQRNLSEVHDLCMQGLNRFDPGFLDDLKSEAQKALNNANNSDMKEIKSIGDRLFGLEQLLTEAKKLALEQTDTSNTLFKNQQRFSNYKDNSLLPDLCKSHRMQLEVMNKNHSQLKDLKKRCINSKFEICSNIHIRLKSIMFTEKRMTEIDEKILVHRENIRRLKLHMEIIRQIHLAPRLYVSAVQEVVRRRMFSKTFTDWAVMISNDSAFVFKEETRLRQSFMSLLNNHFLSTMFPGIRDFMPSFALQTPAAFDTGLPLLEVKHLEMLQKAVPELFEVTTGLMTYEHEKVLKKYFCNRDGRRDSEESARIKVINDHVIAFDGRHYVRVSTLMKMFARTTSDAVLLKQEVLRLKESCSNQVSQLMTETASIGHKFQEKFASFVKTVNADHEAKIKEVHIQSKEQVSKLKDDISVLSEGMARVQTDFKQKQSAFDAAKQSWETETQELQKQITQVKMEILDREVELEESKKRGEDQDLIIKSLQCNNSQLTELLTKKDQDFKDQTESIVQENYLLKKEIDRLKQEAHKIESKVEKDLRKEFDAEKSAALKLQRDQLNSEHKQDIETLRSRFRLASSIEKAQDSLSLDSPTFGCETLATENEFLSEQIRDLKKEHQEKIDKLEREYAEKLETVKQITFNDSLNKLSREKDSIILQLKNDIDFLRLQLADKPVAAAASSSERCSTPTLDSPIYQSLDPQAKVLRLESMIREKDNRISKLQDSFRTNMSYLQDRISFLS